MKRVQLRSLRLKGVEESYNKMEINEEVAEERRRQAVRKRIEKILKQSDVRKPKPALRIRIRRFGVKVGRFVFMRFKVMRSMRKRLMGQAMLILSLILPKGRGLNSGFCNGYDGKITLPILS
ncbi:hypothetical protein SUGI_0638460 [Cryptomeria japonica]|nr:hypothetical protein SUGI_0638460 [Cryptomeria japonica]